MYAYVRSQEDLGVQWDKTAGLFLHPAIGESVYEHAEIQGHLITFATVNLTGTTAAIRSELRGILTGQSYP
jgi:5-methylcytosine-specific restriction enzyme subunit McrC